MIQIVTVGFDIELGDQLVLVAGVWRRREVRPASDGGAKIWLGSVSVCLGAAQSALSDRIDEHTNYPWG